MSKSCYYCQHAYPCDHSNQTGFECSKESEFYCYELDDMNELAVPEDYAQKCRFYEPKIVKQCYQCGHKINKLESQHMYWAYEYGFCVPVCSVTCKNAFDMRKNYERN